MATPEERPAKRQKTSDQPYDRCEDQEGNAPSTNRKITKGRNQSRNFKKQAIPRNGVGPSDRADVVRTFSQPSAISAGDKGIFVTCDKGREKKALLELQDLVQQHLDQQNIDTMGNSLHPNDGTVVATNSINPPHMQDCEQDEIEADIAAELQKLKDPSSAKQSSSRTARSVQLITLDIPCVSFLRFPLGSAIDPVQMVHQICDQAASSPLRKSRYIQRLTPISKLEKVLSQGLDKVCDEVLPLYFASSEGTEIQTITFAIRPTIRNSDKIDRNQVIKTVASNIQVCGENKHKVDLKHYQKGVLIEVYRGWVGISVVDNAATDVYRKGYDELKRFNLAEIYAGCGSR